MNGRVVVEVFGGKRAQADGPLIHTFYVLLTYICACLGFVFFRASSLGGALQMLAGMAGLHGAGAILPVSGLEEVKLARDILWIACLYCVVWGMPNTQQIMAQYEPALGRVQPGPLPWLRWRMNLPWAIACGVAALAGVLSIGGTTEFLYFQF